jgi:hypothetical protein
MDKQVVTMILQYGGFGVIAIMFCFLLRWLVNLANDMRQENKRQTEEFLRVSDKFNETIQNHMAHETQILGELRDEIKRK